MGLKFSATSVDECLEKASSELNISKEALKYRVTKEDKGFFRKKVEIEIIENENNLNKSQTVKEFVEEKEIEETNDVFGAKVEAGKIIVTDSENEDEIITIKTCTGVSLYINDQLTNEVTPVTSKDKIEYKFDEIEPIRSMDISITNDKMEAYINIKSTPIHIYELVDQGYRKNLTLTKKKVGDKYPPKYTKGEINDLLAQKGIRYGILKEEIDEITEKHEVINRLIAKGVPVVDDVPDEIQLLFKESEELHYVDTEEKVDYRNRFLIANAKVGDVIGKIIHGKPGSDGQDIFGLQLKRKTAKRVAFKVGEGCKIENNTIIATTEGKPAFKANTFVVNKLYKVEEVDLKSGNIDFVGNVEVVGAVGEGMEVNAGNELHIGKNVESAVVRAGGQITIGGNVLNSTVTAGCENVERRQYYDNLVNLKEMIHDLGASAEQVKKNNLLGPRQYGEIVKILIENKFKSLPKLSRNILNYNMSQGVQQSEITTFIINKMLGMGPLKIKEVQELVDFQEMVKEEIEEIENLIVIPADIYIEYAQGTEIEASGSVFITGKGEYTSNIVALNNIEFLKDKAVCRGGTLSAGNEIKLKTVGSSAGVSTILKVPKKGRITAEIAYNNTIFCFGEKQVMLEVSSKNVEAYLDKTGEITIDKFVL
ncbi:flagellar assembly protein A [Clostridium sp. C2-6-12]|uniref:flagellar assembly protein A n=1 Tax=Clostridium sp. C2-6-12 TaxID=2698832 RepID=UPI0013706239|nr:flagellar assembly protein A [Clostridium sp. C2-6-12]